MTSVPAPAKSIAHPVRSSRGRGIAILAAILSAACWGSATVMSKGVLAHIPPMTLLTIQLTASIIVLWFAVLILRLRVRLDQPTRRAGFSGILEPGLAYTFGIIGLALTTASNAALIGAAEPLLILFLAWFVLKERPDSRLLLLGAAATLGLLLVILPDATGLAGQGSLIGDALIFAGTLFAAFYVITTRRLVSTIEPLPLSALQQSVGLVWTLGVLAVALLTGLATLGLEDLPRSVLFLAVASGVVQYALAFWLYLFALRSLPANLAGFYLTLIPVFGIATASIFLGEVLSGPQWIGAGLIIVAVALVALPLGERSHTAQ